ncbi:anthrone oxygenase family protein [Mycolicibacterium thermoresistibile]
MSAFVQILTILVAGPLVGFELAVAAVLHPRLKQLPDEAFRTARGESARQLGRIMPFWYAGTLVLLIITAVMVPAGQPRALVGVAAATMVLVLIATIALLVPLNNRIVAYPADQPVDELREQSRLWDRLHWRRVILLIAMLVLLLLGTGL